MGEQHKASSQAQQIPGIDNVKKLMDESGQRMGSLLDEVGKAQTKWIEYGNTQIDEVTELWKNQFNYVNELATGFRKLTVDTLKKSMDTMSR
jgi:hypothetical protein